MENKRKPSRSNMKGNQYARKHGFYSRILSAEERRDLELAVEVEGLDEEIALLRVKIKSIASNDPDNIKVLTVAINTLSRLLVTKYKLKKDDKHGIKEAIGNVLKDIALPLGVGIGTGAITK